MLWAILFDQNLVQIIQDICLYGAQSSSPGCLSCPPVTSRESVVLPSSTAHSSYLAVYHLNKGSNSSACAPITVTTQLEGFPILVCNIQLSLLCSCSSVCAWPVTACIGACVWGFTTAHCKVEWFSDSFVYNAAKLTFDQESLKYQCIRFVCLFVYTSDKCDSIPLIVHMMTPCVCVHKACTLSVCKIHAQTQFRQ